TRIADPVASIGRADVAVVRARRAARLLRICRAVRAGARTGLGEIAFARRRPTSERRRLESVVGTRAAAARARLGHVAATARGGATRGPRIARVVDAERTADRAIAEVR